MFKKVINAITTVILVLLIVLVIFVFISRINNNSPSIFGYHVFQVSSGSMEPELMIGDVILDKEVPASEISVGDIITYKGTKGDLTDKIITHKVIRKRQSENGRFIFATKGTAPGAIEDPEFDESYIIGKYQRKIPLLNSLYTFFLSDYGLIVFVGLIVILFAYEMLSIIFSYKSLATDINELDGANIQETVDDYPKYSDEISYDDYKSLDEIQNPNNLNNDNNDNNINGFL